ncbi:MAG: caspase family protein [Proteobacteria bacterium]|nr:caspase family protein [Pseudomonadota bacterium]
MRRFHIARALQIAAAVILSTIVQAEARVALVIGNGKYVHAKELANPANDARAMAGALRDIGFSVVQGTDLDRPGMERLLFEFLDKARSARVALIFYAGHGLQVEGRNYLIPVDAKLESARDLNFGMIELDKMLASLDVPNRANIIILDACRDNPLARSFAAKTRSGAVGTGLAALSALGTGTLIAFATAPDRVALDGDGANSPFTESLVKHLRTPGIEVRTMLTRVRNDVALATGERQVPWDNSSLRGEVYLAGRAVAAEPIAGAKPQAPPSGPSADQIAWRFLQNTTDISALRRFTAEFPSSAMRRDAEARIATLEREAQARDRATDDRRRADAEDARRTREEHDRVEALRRADEERGRVAALPPPQAAPNRPVDARYPQRRITLVVPYSPGGQSDVIGRLIAARLAEAHGQQVIVENRPGAGGAIGAGFVAKAPADGYTLLLGDSNTLGITPAVNKNAGYDPRKDFVGAGLVATLPMALVVTPSLPARTVAEFIAYAKARPGKVAYGTSGSGTLPHLAAELFASTAGASLMHVPYRGLAPAMADLIAGHIHVCFCTISVIAPQLREGKLRALAVTGATRSSLLPDVPTMAQAGVGNYEAVQKYGFVVPKGTPSGVVEKLNAMLRAALSTADLRNRLTQLGVEPASSTTDAFAASIAQDGAQWSKVIRDAGITAN